MVGWSDARPMRAVRFHEYGDPDALQVDEVESPEPGAGEVLARVEAASVNGIDLLFRDPDDQFQPPQMPWIPGCDFAGVVEAVGSTVDAYAVGDRVAGSELGGFIPGTYAESVAVPTDRIAPLPESVGFAEGAAIGHVGLTAWRALIHHAGLAPTQTLLVHGGTGGVGHLAVQLAAVVGADVTATSKDAARRDWLADHGADRVLDYSAAGFRDELLETLGAGNVEVVLDGHVDHYLELDLELLTKDGVIVNLEFSEHHGTASFSGRHTRMGNKKEARIQFMGALHTPDVGGTLGRLLGLADDGRLDVVVDETYPLEDAARAQREYRDRDYVGKLVLEP